MKNMRTLQNGSHIAPAGQSGCGSYKNHMRQQKSTYRRKNVFVCIRGSRMDGHAYTKEAVERGAAVLVASGNWKGFRKR